ncbi:MAG TPA: efflux RND transporter permease subunit [Spirochaetota bacterium]|nr:efflux RND transporter permease subunit [Spirochaetota bacterium]
MKKIIENLMHQKLLVGLLIFMVCLTGFNVAKNLNRESYPDVNFDMVSISTVYPGGSPDEIEDLVTIPIEKKLRSISGIDKVRSYNVENVSVVVAYLDDTLRTEMKDKAVQDIRDAVDLVNNLPSTAMTPVVEEITFETTPAIDIAVYGKKDGVPYKEIREAANDLEDFLYDINGVGEVEFFGYEDREYLIEVNPDALERYRIGMNTVINTLKMRNIDLPGGSLKVGDTEYVLRTKGQYKNADEIRNTVIMSNDAGFITRIRDVATVEATYAEPDVYERFNGHRAVLLRVWRQRSMDEIRLVNDLRKKMATYRPTNTQNVNISLYNDVSRYSRESIERVVSNAVVGFIFLALILLLLLGWRMSSIVSIGIPVAFMIAIIGMKVMDITFNVISLFGMVMVLGMIVDFSIVVTENSHRYMEMGMKKADAIVRGTHEMFWPVTVTLLCICAAFSPLLFLSGLMGKFVIGIPIVLITCLVASWFIAMFIMPTLLHVFSKENDGGKDASIKDEDPNYEKGLFGKFQRQYKRLLGWSLNHRYITTLILVILFIGSMVVAGIIGFQFMTKGGEESFTVRTTMAQETNLEANLREMRKIERVIAAIPKHELDNFHTSVGNRVTDPIDPAPGEATHKSTIEVFLSSVRKRERSADDIEEEFRKKILALQRKGGLYRDMLIEVEVERHGPPMGKPVNIELRGKDFAVLKKIAAEYVKYMKTIKGLQGIRVDLEDGKKEYRFRVNEVLATRSGISVNDVAQALNASFEGAIASTLNQDEENVALRVRFPEWARKRKESISDVMIANKSGGLMPLNMVASVQQQPGYTEINRLNYKRVVQVQANVDTNYITSLKANIMLAEKFKNIEQRYPGYDVAYGGENEESAERMGELGVLFIFALLVIFTILAVFFNSLMIPLVVMIAIPFALVGMILALWAHGQPLSFMSALGFFSLAGVIVSNTLVLVQFINNMRDDGLPLKEALLEAGVIRIRPILLTTGTTVLGLFPSIYGIGGKDYMVAPLALAFGYGLIFATIITLILVPSFYYIAEDIKGVTAKLLGLFGIKMKKTIYTPRETAAEADI